RPQHEEGAIGGREARQYLDERVKHEIGHEGQLAAVAVGEQAEDQRPHGPEGGGQRDGQRDGGVGGAELPRDGRQRHHDEKEIEGVERPAEEPGEQGGALIGGRRGRRGHLVSRSRGLYITAGAAIPRPGGLPMVTYLIMAFVCALAPREGTGGVPAAEPPRDPAPLVAVLALRFDGEHATVLEPGDTAVAAAAVAAAEAGGNRCDARCAVEIGRQVGARWVVAGTLVKTSNLVWVLLGELRDVASGRTVLADSYELKGDAARMAPAGAHVFAQRVERAVTAAGVTPAGRAAP